MKALHIIAVIAWMAGLLYLPRLYVYHAGVPAESNRAAMLRDHGAAAAARHHAAGGGDDLWFRRCCWRRPRGGRLAARLDLGEARRWSSLLTVFHMLLARWRRDFAAGKYPHTARFYRIVNEMPTIMMIAIVLLVVVKPF